MVGTGRAAWAGSDAPLSPTICRVVNGTQEVVSGTVLDPSGLPVTDATVEAACGSYARQTVTDKAGHYALTLPVGAFTITAQQTGFAQTTIVLPATPATGKTDLVLSMAGSSNSVTVKAGPDFVGDETEAGTKTNTPLVNTPQNISVVTLAQMQSRDVQSVADTLRYAGGVDAEPYGTDTRVDWFFIRGFSETFDGLFLDGLALPKISGADAAWTANPFSLESVDIIKGPASVLYGQGEPGGLVNLESRRPPLTPEGTLRFEAGNYDRYQGFADFGGPLGRSGKLFYRVNGLARSSGTQVEFTQDDEDYIAPSLIWTPDSRTSLMILNNYLDLRTGSTGGFLPAQGMLLDGGKVAPNANGKIPVSFFDSDPSYDGFHKIEYFSGYQFQRQLSSRWTVRQNFRFARLELPTYIGLYGTGFVVPTGDGTLCTANPNAAECTRTLSRSAINGNQNNAQYAVDNQVQGSLRWGNWSHTLLAGYNYQHQGTRSQLGYGPSAAYDPAGTPGLAPNIDVFAPVYGLTIPVPGFVTTNTNGTLAQHGVYLQDQASYGKLSMILSGREDWALENTQDDIGGDTVHQDASKFTGRAGVLYHTALGLAPYFSYATSFNPIPGVYPSGPGQPDAGKAYIPDTGEQYEVGAKYQPRGINAFVTASLFQITENNVLTTDPTGVYTTQGAQERSRGVEIEGQASLGHNIDLLASATHEQVLYTKPYYGVEDVRPPTVPENLASLWADYKPANGFGAGAGLRFTGVTPGAADNSFFVPGHQLLDGEVHYTTGPLRVGLNGQNLFDKTYVSYCYGVTDCNYGYQRTFNGNLTFSFSSLLHPWKED
jgi:iron complex outermembrane receptor protein